MNCLFIKISKQTNEQINKNNKNCSNIVQSSRIVLIKQSKSIAWPYREILVNYSYKYNGKHTTKYTFMYECIDNRQSCEDGI